MAWTVLWCSWLCLMGRVVRAALCNGAHHWETWAFGGCFPGAAVHLCVCVHVLEWVHGRIRRRAPSDMQAHSRSRTRGLKEGGERQGPVPVCNSLYGHLSQKWPRSHQEISFLLQLWAVAAQLQLLSLTMFILRFTAGEKRKTKSEGCEQIRGWAHWKNTK